MITRDDIFRRTNGGKDVILRLFPASEAGFERRHNFKIRPDDKNASCTVFQASDGTWLLQDKGGADTKAKNAIQLVMEIEGLDFAGAITWIAQNFCPDLLDEKEREKILNPEPTVTEAPAIDTIAVNIRPSGEFTKAELAMLGYEITPDICAELCLKPLDSYVTQKNKEGKSFQIAGNEGYPMYYYDYTLYGKIYCPLSKKFRFQWKDKAKIQTEDEAAFSAWEQGGKKGPAPKSRIIPFSGEKDFMTRYTQAVNGEWKPEETVPTEDGDGEEVVDKMWDKLIICSGPSDALNVKSAGYHVCWPNSETAKFTEYEFNILSSLAKKIYILYDIDETGIRNMYDIALRFLDISIIRLPEDLKKHRDRRGKPCKDAKDFFMYYRKPESQNPVRLFDELVKLSGGLKFWTATQMQKGGWKYDINNDQMYAFLEASGYYTIETTTKTEGFTFCRIEGNKVTLIDKEAIAAECSMYLLEYLRTHPKYYSQALVNAIHRSKQISAGNLVKLRRIHPDFNAFNEIYDYLWFRNGIFRVGADGIVKVKDSECPYLIYSSKIIEHDFSIEQPYFDITPTPELQSLRDQLAKLSPGTPDFYSLEAKIDTMDDMKKYGLEVRKWGSDFMKYVWNTGREYWRDEEHGVPLSDNQQREVRLNFISKCLAIGYMLSKYKTSGQPYALYAMEMVQADEDEHLGGTGKSLFLKSMERIRCQEYVDGQRIDTNNMRFIFQNVVKNMTDTIFLDDLDSKVPMKTFMNMVTGKMTIDVKHGKGFTLDYIESPKLGFTSNHAIRNFDDSLNRRIWFAAFSDYYHSDSTQRKLKLRSPRTEFGKDLIDQFTPDEMNHFYNFMLTCLVMWHKIHERVQPPMKSIMQRTLVRAMGQDFFDWAEDWFIDERLNTYVDQDEAIEAYCKSIAAVNQRFVKPAKFKEQMKLWCQYHADEGYVFNPDSIFTNASDLKHQRIHKKVNGADHYYFYVDTKGDVIPPVEPAPEGGPGAGPEPLPPSPVTMDSSSEGDDDAPF